MSPFWLLILAHMISDFPLQTDRIYQIKKKYVWGVFLHVGVCTAINCIFLVPYLGNWQAWLVILFLFVIHAVLDRSKILLTARWFKDGILYFLADQVMHITTIWLVSYILIDWNSLSVTFPILPAFYQNIPLQIVLSGLVFAVFGGAPIDYYVLVAQHQRENKNPMLNVDFPGFLQRIPGFLERFLATFGIVLGGLFYLFLPVALVPPLLLASPSEKDVRYYRLITSLFLSIVVGFFVRMLLGMRVI